MTTTFLLALASRLTSSVGRALVFKFKGPGFKPTCDHSPSSIKITLNSAVAFLLTIELKSLCTLAHLRNMTAAPTV